jgi:hypothetical protein
MLTIEYTIQYTGAVGSPRSTALNFGTYGTSYETVRVEAININAGFAKALKIARQPLGNGQVREIGGIEFSQVVTTYKFTRYEHAAILNPEA